MPQFPLLQRGFAAWGGAGEEVEEGKKSEVARCRPQVSTAGRRGERRAVRWGLKRASFACQARCCRCLRAVRGACGCAGAKVAVSDGAAAMTTPGSQPACRAGMLAASRANGAGMLPLARAPPAAPLLR